MLDQYVYQTGYARGNPGVLCEINCNRHNHGVLLRVRARTTPILPPRPGWILSRPLGTKKQNELPARLMLSAPLHFKLDEDEWTPPPTSRLYRATSWAVTSIGRGFDWNEHDDAEQPERSSHKLDPISQYSPSQDLASDSKLDDIISRKHPHSFLDRPSIIRSLTNVVPSQKSPLQSLSSPASQKYSPTVFPSQPRCSSPSVLSPIDSYRQTPGRSPSSPRPRRRSSQQRVSLVAGRVLIAPIEPPSPPPMLTQNLRRTGSSGSFLSTAASTRAPSPASENQSFLGGRSLSDFVIEGEIGRGAYGLVKRGRELLADGSLGPPLVIKQVIKSRILADCWKKHSQHGTIPIEIYVMSAISNTAYTLPPRRPWNPSRLKGVKHSSDGIIDKNSSFDDQWIEGKVVKGHPNICPLMDFFEDQHYYYLVLPSTTPLPLPNEPPSPSDLFDLVENYPHGLPPDQIRSYLGQIADALCFLHSQGIVHRDVKDENVVLGPNGKSILIDFGSSGLVKKNGWDTFSGTLDYAGPEILRGERYYGKEQDVWAFGVVAYVLLVGECPFMTAAEAQDGLESPFATASISLDERCGDEKESAGEEYDGGGALGDAAALVRACLRVDVTARPTFEKILKCRFLAGKGGWGMEGPL